MSKAWVNGIYEETEEAGMDAEINPSIEQRVEALESAVLEMIMGDK